MPVQSKSSILLISRSCSVFPLRKPTGIGHQNLIPVPIPSTTKASPPESCTGICGNISWISKIPGRTHAAITHIMWEGGCGMPPMGLRFLCMKKFHCLWVARFPNIGTTKSHASVMDITYDQFWPVVLYCSTTLMPPSR